MPRVAKISDITEQRDDEALHAFEAVETTEQFDRQFKKSDRAVQRRVLSRFEGIESLEDPGENHDPEASG